ncbi:MAG: hypothetical protein ACYTGP_13130 [Planctomycetota bacterium]|jgi:hypothetical protein
MRIDGSIPLHVARAYGLGPAPRAPRPAPAATPALQVGAPRPPALDRLVAARTTAPIEFDAASTPASSADSLPLYDRAADRVEAAVAVQVGRTIDVRG